MRDACGTGQLAQRQGRRAALGHQGSRLAEDGGLQIAMVVGVLAAHRAIIARDLDTG